MSTSWTEQALVFRCGDEALVGVLTAPQPPQTPQDIGVLVIVGGPQYRAGSHRQFVLLARRLAEHGFPVLRFDSCGMGDSTGALRGFESLSPDIGAAVDALHRLCPKLSKVVLWGLCDGASAALLYCHETSDARVGGLCLLNPWVRSDAGLARTHVKHYYAQRAMQPEFWTKLFRGKVGVGALAGLAHDVRLAVAGTRRPVAAQVTAQVTFQDRMAVAWSQFQHKILLLLSTDDYTAKEFLEHVGTEAAWANALIHPHLERHDVTGADHTFSSGADRIRAEDLTLAWLASLQAHGRRVQQPADGRPRIQ